MVFLGSRGIFWGTFKENERRVIHRFKGLWATIMLGGKRVKYFVSRLQGELKRPTCPFLYYFCWNIYEFSIVIATKKYANEFVELL